jgi:hypothetical protein
LNPSPADDVGGPGFARPALVAVTDRRHPLHGKSFPVVSVASTPASRGHVFVTYAERALLMIPVAATSLQPGPPAGGTKLTAEAIEDLAACFREVERECLSSPATSGDASPPPCATPRSATSRRRCRR